MTAFLDYPYADYGSKTNQGWQNTVIKDDLGKVIQVRDKGRTSPFWTVTLNYNRPVSYPVGAFNWSVFQSAVRALRGGAVPCFFYTPSPWDWWDAAPAGTGDGSRVLFPFGGCDLATDQATPVVLINGAPLPQFNSDFFQVWAIAPIGSDPYNRWQVNFGAGGPPPGPGDVFVPGVGDVVQVSFMGRRLLFGNLIADPGEISNPAYARIQWSLQLQGEEVGP